MFGVDLIDASLFTAMLIALAAGTLSFLSPCVLPIVAPYMAFISGTSLDDVSDTRQKRWQIILSAVFFVLGLSTVFLFLGLAASALGQIFLQYQREMAIVSGIVVFLFGLHFLHIINIPFLNREARIDAGDRGGNAIGAYILGLAFAFGWTPCIGPILGTVLSLAAQESSVQRGMILMAVYAFGLGLPFILVAVFITRSLGYLQRIKPHLGKIEKAMGILLVIVGIMLTTGLFTTFSYWLLETFPALGLIG
jgi:cytochrome c-type biogenesis protein